MAAGGRPGACRRRSPRGVRLLPYFDAYTVGCHPREQLFPGLAAQRALSRGQAGNVPVLLRGWRRGWRVAPAPNRGDAAHPGRAIPASWMRRNAPGSKNRCTEWHGYRRPTRG